MPFQQGALLLLKTVFQMRKIIALLCFSVLALPSAAVCPCSTASLCKPIMRPPVAEREVLAFDPSPHKAEWLVMDWSKITTIASFTWPVSDELYCYAHSKGVRVVKCADTTVKAILTPSI